MAAGRPCRSRRLAATLRSSIWKIGAARARWRRGPESSRPWRLLWRGRSLTDQRVAQLAPELRSGPESGVVRELDHPAKTFRRIEAAGPPEFRLAFRAE